MPLDIALFREFSGGNPELIRESQRRRFASVELVDEIIAKDTEWRLLTGDIDNLKKNRNAVQKEVGKKKQAKVECEDLVAEIKTLGEKILATETAQKEAKIVLDKMVGKIGNIVDASVPVSKDEDADNLIVRSWGIPRDPAGLLNHHDLLWRIGGYEPERGVAVAGHRGYFLRDVGVMLNQAFINYGIAFLRARSYCMLQPPYFMKKEVMAGVAQLEQFDEELYKVGGGDGDDKYLIATSEQPICGYHMGEWMDEKSLPLRYGGVSTCFRKEAGAHGKDTWGIFRVHQFEKVEQFVVVEGDLEKSKEMQEEMIAASEAFYQSLGFPYHVISIVSGALNNAAIKKLDLECWFPGYNAYRELVSCSNCTDYQSRSMEIRCGNKKLGDREKKYVHMLNSTLCATGRAICCLLETYQEADGVRVPDVLVPYMGGLTFLPFVRDSKLPDKVPTPPTVTTKNAASAGAAAASAAAAVVVVVVPPPAPVAASDAEAAIIVPVVAAAAVVVSVIAMVAAAAVTDSVVSDVAVVDVVDVVVSPAEQACVAAILSKGEELRMIKTNKGTKEDIKVLVEQLLELKTQYQLCTGRAYAVATVAGAAGGGGGDKKEKKEKKEKKDTTVTPVTAAAVTHAPAARPVPTGPVKPAPAVIKSVSKSNTCAVVVGLTPCVAPAPAPAPAVVVVTAAPTYVRARKTSFSAPVEVTALVKADGSVDFVTLEKRLVVFSYIGGFSVGKEDARLFALVTASGQTSFAVNTTRWVRQISSYTATEQEAWL